MDKIKDLFKQLLESGKITGTIGGPKENVLVCATLNDYCISSTEMIYAGYSVLSPGGFIGGVANDVSRKALDARVWRYGTVCAISYNKKTLFYHDKYLNIVVELEESKKNSKDT